MYYYNYYKSTKAFYGPPKQARVVPLREELSDDDMKKWLLPKNATWVEPPSYDTNTEIPVWNGESWNVVVDHRDKEFWNKQTQEKIVWKMPEHPGDEWTEKQPNEYTRWSEENNNWEVSVEDKNEDYANQINIVRAQKILQGYTTEINGKTITIQGADVDKIILLGLVTISQMRIADGDTTTLTAFRDANNVTHQLTPAELIQLWTEGFEYMSNVYQASWNLKDQAEIPDSFAGSAHWPVAVSNTVTANTP